MKGSNTSPVLTPFSACNTIEAFSDGRDYFNIHPDQPPHTRAYNGLDAATTKKPTPVDEVPNEILAHVLELAYLSDEHPDDDFRRTVTHTCSRFRQVALGTPSLWSKYHLTQGNILQYLPHLERYLQLSKGYPLDVYLSCFWSHEITGQVVQFLFPHSSRWRRLSITTPNSDIFAFLVDVPAPILEHLSVAHFSSQQRLSIDYPAFGGHVPNLSQLVLRNVSLDRVNIPLRNLAKLEIRGHGVWPDFDRLEGLLGGSETLQDLVLHVKPGMIVQDLYQGIHQGPLSLPALRNFTVFTSEWLTDDVARLVRSFATPSLETLTVQEGFGHDLPDSTDILRYSASPAPRLVANSCNFILACRCLSPEQLESLRTLEVCKPEWNLEWEANNLIALREIMRGMLSLEKLVLADLNPYTALNDFGLASTSPGVLLHGLNLPPREPPTVEPISLPSLRTLDIDMIRDFRPAEDELAHFIRLFSLPALSSLILRHLTQVAWEHTLEFFAGRTTSYPNLTSLTVAGAPTLKISSTCSPAVAFPRLQNLSMLHVPSSVFLCHLAVDEHAEIDDDNAVPWPDLSRLTIHGDGFRSRPLLHKVIEVREKVGRPIQNLLLDSMFRSNRESWEWIKQRVPGTVEIPRARV